MQHQAQVVIPTSSALFNPHPDNGSTALHSACMHDVTRGIEIELVLRCHSRPRSTGMSTCAETRCHISLRRFVSGSADSKWGSLRAEQGHPDPWALNYFAIGNEVQLQPLRRSLECSLGSPSAMTAAPYAYARRAGIILPVHTLDDCCAVPFCDLNMQVMVQDCNKPWYRENYIAFFEALRYSYPHLRLIANCDMGDGAPTDLYDWHIYTGAKRSPSQTGRHRDALHPCRQDVFGVAALLVPAILNFSPVVPACLSASCTLHVSWRHGALLSLSQAAGLPPVSEQQKQGSSSPSGSATG